MQNNKKKKEKVKDQKREEHPEFEEDEYKGEKGGSSEMELIEDDIIINPDVETIEELEDEEEDPKYIDY